MEVYYYVCPVCGYVHQVPAYWMGYAPEDETDMPHIDPRNGEVCAGRKRNKHIPSACLPVFRSVL